MKRKLIQHGNSSLTVVLPRKWIKKNNLSKGGEVDIDLSENNLVIGTEARYPSKTLSIDVQGMKYTLRRIVTACYKAGYDNVHINFRSHGELAMVKDAILRSATGFEILNQTKENLDLKNIGKNDFSEFDIVLRRFFLIVNQIAEESVEAIEKKDFEWMQMLILLKSEVGKFSDYCRRAINMGYSSGFKRIGPLYVIIEELERVSRDYRTILRYISSEKIKVSKPIINFMKMLASYEYSFYEVFYNFSLNKIEELGKRRRELEAYLAELELKVLKKEIFIVSSLRAVLWKIYDLTGPLAVLYL